MRVGHGLSGGAGVDRLRLGVVVRPLWLLVTGAGLAAFATALPGRWRFLNTPCAGAACEPGQPTVAGLELLARTGLPPGFYGGLLFSFNLLVPALIILVMGAVLWRKPESRVAVALAFGGTTCSLLGGVHEAAAVRGWLGPLDEAYGLLAGTGLAFGLLAFPDGRFRPRWGRLLALPLLAAPFAAPFGPAGESVAAVGFMLTFPCALVLLLLRYRRTASLQHRQQLKWTLYGLGLLVFALLGGLLVSLVLPPAWNAPGAPGDLVTSLVAGGSILCFWLCLALAVLRYRLFDIDLVVRRTLLYGGLTLGVGAVYGLLVATAGVLSLGSDNLLVSLFATGTVALVFGPLRARLQRGVDRLLYGGRSEPYQVVADLTERLGGPLEPAQVFPVTALTVATALKLPYADIALGLEHETVARYGEPGREVEHFNLVYAGEALGRLSVSPRPGEPRLSSADRQLLTNLSRQVGVAAHAFLLAADLERSRLRLVSAREEARRRLGNDLHDSVGGALAGLLRRAEAARNALETDPERARALLDELAAGSRSAALHVRGLAHQLHPPELELLGLAGAVREAVAAADTVPVTLQAPDLPRLPAAAEVAALYTAKEALHNVVRHAHARSCRVRLTLRRDLVLGALAAPVLELEVTDDGCGLGSGHRPGLGLRSMAARAAELGGRCVAEALEGGGTRVLMQLPCPEP